MNVCTGSSRKAWAGAYKRNESGRHLGGLIVLEQDEFLSAFSHSPIRRYPVFLLDDMHMYAGEKNEK